MGHRPLAQLIYDKFGPRYTKDDIYFYLQANIEHISIVSAGSTFPEEFSRCSDANCAAPYGGKLFHCTLCCRSPFYFLWYLSLAKATCHQDSKVNIQCTWWGAKEAICNLMKHTFSALNVLNHGIVSHNIIVEFDVRLNNYFLKMTLSQFFKASAL